MCHNLPPELLQCYEKYLGRENIREYLEMDSDEKVVDAIGRYGVGGKWWVYEEKSTNIRQALKQIENTLVYTEKKNLNVVITIVNIGKIKSPAKKNLKARKITRGMIEKKDIPKYPNFDKKKHKFLWNKDKKKFERFKGKLFIRMI